MSDCPCAVEFVIEDTAGPVFEITNDRSVDFEAGDAVIPAGMVSDYDQLNNKPQINGVELSGDKSTAELIPELANLVIVCGTPVSIPAEGSSVSKNVAGLTAAHRVSSWGFSESAENAPPCSLTLVTAEGYFTLTNNGGATSETVQPVFVLPTVAAVTNRA